jgi:hypothetical protein
VTVSGDAEWPKVADAVIEAASDTLETPGGAKLKKYNGPIKS